MDVSGDAASHSAPIPAAAAALADEGSEPSQPDLSFNFDGHYGTLYQHVATASMPGRQDVYTLGACAIRATAGRSDADAALDLGSLPQARSAHGLRVLLAGGGGGTDLVQLAKGLPEAQFIVEDISAGMIDAAKRAVAAWDVQAQMTLGHEGADLIGPRVTYVYGSVTDAVATAGGPFDAVVAFLVDHFMSDADGGEAVGGERTRFYRELCTALKPGGPLLLMASHVPRPVGTADDGLQTEQMRLLSSIQTQYQLQAGLQPEEIVVQRQRIATGVVPITEARLTQLLALAGFQPPLPLARVLRYGMWLARKA